MSVWARSWSQAFCWASPNNNGPLLLCGRYDGIHDGTWLSTFFSLFRKIYKTDLFEDVAFLVN